MSLQTLTRKKQPFVTLCCMPASEKLCNFVPFDLSRWKKKPLLKTREQWIGLIYDLLCWGWHLNYMQKKKEALFFPLSSLPASFVPLPHFVRRLLVDRLCVRVCSLCHGKWYKLPQERGKNVEVLFWHLYFSICLKSVFFVAFSFFSTVLTANWMLKDFHVS